MTQAPSSPARMTSQAGRNFAWTLALGFAVLATIGFWRGRRRTALLFAALASIALLAGLLVPTRLGAVERAWLRFGEALSRVTSPIFFSLLYLLVLTPVGVLRRNFGRSPLARSRQAESFWIKRPSISRDDARASLEHLF
jgi:hypothetical protein